MAHEISNILSLGAQLIPLVSAHTQAPSSSSSSFRGESNQIKAELKRLMRFLMRIKATMYDAEERGIRDHAVKLWLKELRAVALEAEDLLDEYHYEFVRAQVEARGASPSNSCERVPIQVTVDMVDRIHNICSKLHEIKNDQEALQLLMDEKPRHHRRHLQIAPTSSFAVLSNIIGREREKEELIDLLSSESHGGGIISVVTIVGLGGIGKTTLAQLVYNDQRIHQIFDIFGWVCISEDFNVQRITRDVVQSITRTSCGVENMSALQEKISKIIRGKRILLVLDDVWNEERSNWELLRTPFMSASLVKILVTTRNEPVARIMQTVATLNLGYMSEDQSWQLFQHYAFGEVIQNTDPNLVGIGKQIMKKCGALPLALKSMANLLRHEMKEEFWREVLERELHEIDVSNEIFESLQRSYALLPTYLKPCFLYCSMFPRDYLYSAEELVQLWIYQGYIQTNGLKNKKATGLDYAKQLWQRSFLQGKYEEEEFYFTLHEMVHYLAQSKSGHGCHCIEGNMFTNFPDRGLYHLYVRGGQALPVEPPPSQMFASLRTLIVDSCAKSFLSAFDFSKAQKLRVLKLESIDLEFHFSLDNLKLLRYLFLSNGHFERLPQCICSLCKLQNLTLKDCPHLIELPKDIGNLVNLEELTLEGCGRLRRLPASLGQLKALQELSLIRCSSLQFIQEESLPLALEKINISFCDNLIFVTGLQGLKSLVKLDITDCRKLNLLDHCEEICSITVSRCPKLREWCSQHDIYYKELPCSNFEESRSRRNLMAASWPTSPIIANILRSLRSEILVTPSRFGGLKNDFVAMEAVLVRLNSLIGDAEKKQSLGNATAAIWLKEVSAAAYDMDDLLKNFRLEFQRKTELRSKLSIISHLKIILSHSMVQEVKKMRVKLDMIWVEGRTFEFGEERGLSISEKARRQRESSSVFGGETLIIGRDKDMENLISLILGRSKNLVSIVGLGGIGKTALAKFVFNDNNVKQHFERRVWVHVSMEFDLKKIGESVLRQVSGYPYDYSYRKYPDLWTVRHNLDEQLYDKRCLIVLDDLWEQNAENLGQLFFMLSAARSLSSILVTTCSEKVALLMNSSVQNLRRLSGKDSWESVVKKLSGLSGKESRECLATLSGLSDEDSWDFSPESALECKQECDNSLIDIGMQLMERYNGIPLVAKALGHALQFKEESAWLAAKDGNFWDLLGDDIFSSLQLNYYNMPPDLKLCFIYFAVFPNDIHIEKDKLVRQWSALGFIQPTGENSTPESIGDEYVNSLLSIYFLEPWANDARKVLMHNLVLDLARYYAGDEVLILDGSKKKNVNFSTYGPHYALLLGKSTEIQKGLLKRVRALHFSECTADLVNRALLETLYLRVLNLSGCSLTNVPSSIKQLKHLRYLDASSLPIEALPESIGKLTLLIYLDLSNCPNLRSLPGSLVNLKELQTLNLSYCGELEEIPGKMFENNVSLAHLLMKGCPASPNFSVHFLKNLKIYEGCLPAHHIKQLENLDQISGDLELTWLDDATLEDARSANLCRKSGVHALKLHWTAFPLWRMEESISDEDMLFNLQPSRKLKQFHIDGYRATQYPDWLMSIRSSLPDLEMICISNLPRCDHLPPLGQLSNLQELRLSNLPKIEKIEWDSNSGREMFGRLKRLFLHDLSNLREWSFKEILLLNEVEVIRCPLLSFKPGIPESISWVIDESSLVLSSENSLQHSPYKSETTAKIKINGCYPSSDGWRALQNLTALQELEISSCDTLTTLPESIRALTNLSSLKITNCHDLAELPEWIIELTSLRELQIRECFRLKILPESVNHIPMLTLDRTLEEFESYAPSGGYITPMKETEFTPRVEQLYSDSDVEDLDLISWTCLENVKTTELEEKANMCNKPEITAVTLHWTTFLERSGEFTVPDEALLEKLQPHSNLQHLKLDGYMARELASWLMNINSHLPNLVQLNLCNLAKCDHLPPLGQLKKLTELRIWNLPNLKKINYDFCGSRGAFPQLKILSLGHMLNLEEWEINSVARSGEDMQLLFINKLEVIRCPKLVFKPFLPGSNHFTIQESTKALSSEGYSGPPTVSSLYYLKIRDCGLSFDGWNRLQLVNGLKEMVVDSCQDLRTLPESMRSLTSLESLDITSCKNIAWLPEWLGNLLSLRVLHIHDCCNLSRLPDCLQNLSSLKTLRVINCSSMLVARCMQEDKIKIAHIPRVFIEEDGGQEIYWNNI